MKPSPLKYPKKIRDETNAFANMIENLCKKIQKEYKVKCLQAFNELILSIAHGEDLNPLELKEKYLNNITAFKIKKNSLSNNNLSTESETLLDKTIIDDETYFYENKENGNIYNEKGNIVGSYDNNQFSFS